MRTASAAAVSLALAFAASACAPASSGAGSTPPPEATVNRDALAANRGGVVAEAEVEAEYATAAKVVAHDAARAWSAAPRAYQALGIPAAVLDAGGRVFGNDRFAPGRRLLGQPLSVFLDCGVDQMGASQADTYTVTLDVRTRVAAAGAGQAELRTTLGATARPRTGSTSGATRCTSRGLLEQRINTAIGVELARDEV